MESEGEPVDGNMESVKKPKTVSLHMGCNTGERSKTIFRRISVFRPNPTDVAGLEFPTDWLGLDISGRRE